jgi:methylenetetrahydrofolate dehydrogenase (NADP+)/methenyltetrahydrofolate cyclohydrolase
LQNSSFFVQKRIGSLLHTHSFVSERSFRLSIKREMAASKILDGKKVATQLLDELIKIPLKRKPGLATILVGNRPDSAKYVHAKHTACAKVGVDTSKSIILPDTLKLQDKIDELNEDDTVDGILLQLPLPDQRDQERFISRISYTKDVDGFHPYNIGMLCRSGEANRQGGNTFFCSPCTPAGIMHLLKTYQVDLVGKKAVVLGRSNVVGLPMSLMLTHANATVTVLHSHSKNVQDECRNADLVVAAIGKPNLVKASWIKPGAVVVDVGINFVNGKMTGDVDFNQVKEVASLITPVPGGVGPMTVAMLISNTIHNAISRNQ